MALPTAKELKRLAAACRKAGITHIKHGDLELTISEEAPRKAVKAQGSTLTTPSAQPDTIESDGWDSLTDEQKLFWSTGGEEAFSSGETA